MVFYKGGEAVYARKNGTAMEDRRLLHEVWDELDESGEAHTVLLGGPRGDSGRRCLGPDARLRTRFEASSWFEAMTIYYRLMEWGEYKNDPAWDCEPYPEEWVREQREADGADVPDRSPS